MTLSERTTASQCSEGRAAPPGPQGCRITSERRVH